MGGQNNTMFLEMLLPAVVEQWADSMIIHLSSIVWWLI